LAPHSGPDHCIHGDSCQSCRPRGFASINVPAEARTLLAKFGLGADDVLRLADSLSPGERTRAELALLMHRGANLLVLDEPTNHLDLLAILQLEQALNSYDGTLLLVTHDRRFLAKVKVNRYLQLVDGVLAPTPDGPGPTR
jgi:ATPase subunit of ABC transporter with duplicated ATPase domains